MNELIALALIMTVVCMAWTDGVDRATGYLITSTDWNNLLGANGSLMLVKPYVFKQVEGSTSGAVTIDWSLGLTCEQPTTGNITGITLTNGITGGWHALLIKYGGAHTIVFTTTIKWAGGVTPTFTSVNLKTDIVNLYLHTDGTWSGEFSGNH